MTKRVTIVLRDEFVKKIRERQANLIKKTSEAVSFSKIVNDVIREGLKKT